MLDLDWSESTVLADWAETECKHLDLVGSWEVLMSVYEALGFTGPDTDDARLAEFKQVITEVNKFLTRMKNGLARTRRVEDALDFLDGHVNVEMGSVTSRQSVAYNKFKQQWIRQAAASLCLAAELAQQATTEGESDDR